MSGIVPVGPGFESLWRKSFALFLDFFFAIRHLSHFFPKHHALCLQERTVVALAPCLKGRTLSCLVFCNVWVQLGIL